MDELQEQHEQLLLQSGLLYQDLREAEAAWRPGMQDGYESAQVAFL